MSRVYFHSPSGEAELRGSERAWLAHVARGPAEAAWNFDATGLHCLDRPAELLALIPEVSDGQYGANYLHTSLRKAQAQEELNKEAFEGWKPGAPLRRQPDFEPTRMFIQALKTHLNVSDSPVLIDGFTLHTRDIELNTALAAGSDPVRLAAKVHGWCESHAFVEGKDRAWLAGIIDEGLRTGIYRRGIWYVDRPCNGPAADQPDRKWSSQGWEEVQAFLCERDDEPVVMSYSVCDQFPNADVASWMPPWPEGVEERWDALTEEQQAERSARRDAWYDLDGEEQWRRGIEGLRAERPWARLAPGTLASVTFGPGVTIYDLFAPDRDERVRAAFAEDN